MLHRHPEEGARLVAPLLPVAGRVGPGGGAAPRAVRRHRLSAPAQGARDLAGRAHRLRRRRLRGDDRAASVQALDERRGRAPGAGARGRDAARSRHRPCLPQRLGGAAVADHRVRRVDRPDPAAGSPVQLRRVRELRAWDGHRHRDDGDRPGGGRRHRPVADARRRRARAAMRAAGRPGAVPPVREHSHRGRTVAACDRPPPPVAPPLAARRRPVPASTAPSPATRDRRRSASRHRAPNPTPHAHADAPRRHRAPTAADADPGPHPGPLELRAVHQHLAECTSYCNNSQQHAVHDLLPRATTTRPASPTASAATTSPASPTARGPTTRAASRSAAPPAACSRAADQRSSVRALHRAAHAGSRHEPRSRGRTPPSCDRGGCRDSDPDRTGSSPRHQRVREPPLPSCRGAPSASAAEQR